MEKQIKITALGNKDIENMSNVDLATQLSILNNLGSISFSSNIIKKSTASWLRKITSKSSERIIKDITRKLIEKYSINFSRMVVQNSILVSTSWANPIIPFINNVSTALNWISIVLSLSTITSTLALSFF